MTHCIEEQKEQIFSCIFCSSVHTAWIHLIDHSRRTRVRKRRQGKAEIMHHSLHQRENMK